jgi:hypothetical protein
MTSNQAQINKVDNGFIVSLTKIDILTQKPEQKAAVFTDFDAVVEFLKSN